MGSKLGSKSNLTGGPKKRAHYSTTDITLLGANNSSVTVKTDLVDVKVDASSLGVDFGGNYTLSGNDVLQAAVDIIGIFDPTPTSDILGASMSAKSGDYWGASASVLGAILPYAGDLAKTGKIANGIDKISEAILKIDVADANRIERGLLDAPTKQGNALGWSGLARQCYPLLKASNWIGLT